MEAFVEGACLLADSEFDSNNVNLNSNNILGGSRKMVRD